MIFITTEKKSARSVRNFFDGAAAVRAFDENLDDLECLERFKYIFYIFIKRQFL